MWIELAFVECQNDRVIIEKYRLEEEGFIDGPPTITTPDFIAFILGKTRMTLQIIVLKGRGKTNMRMTDYEEWIRRPLQALPQLIRA